MTPLQPPSGQQVELRHGDQRAVVGEVGGGLRGETLPEPQRRRSLAVEPMTCPPNAFASGDGRTLLPRDATLAGTWGINVA